MTKKIDNFLRSVQWVLWCRATDGASDTALIVSPEEANALIPIMRGLLRHPGHTTHLVLYAAPVTRRMMHFDTLNYYAIPALPPKCEAPIWLRIQIGLFAGRLYFGWEEYTTLLDYLGVSRPRDEQTSDCDEQQEVFAQKPLEFLHKWLTVRRKGQDFEESPMGHVASGKYLSASHPFFDKHDKEKMVDIVERDVKPAIEENDDDEGSGSDDDDCNYHDALEDIEVDNVPSDNESNEEAESFRGGEYVEEDDSA